MASKKIVVGLGIPTQYSGTITSSFSDGLGFEPSGPPERMANGASAQESCPVLQ